jgi:anti-sigma B factor antagonist
MMKVIHQPKGLIVSGLTELNAGNASAFRDEARASLTAGDTMIDVDLSGTTFMDSSGLGALIALQKTMTARGGAVRILNPTPAVQQILELTRLHRVFEIVRA